MSQSEQIARTFADVRVALAARYGIDLMSWDGLDDWAKGFLTEVFDVMLKRHDIAKGHKARPRDTIPAPAQVRADLADISAWIPNLYPAYSQAHDDLEGSGAGDGVGGRGLHDVDPTKEHTFDVRRAAQRSDVGGAGRAIGDARNALYSAHETLQGLVVRHGYRQETKPDSKAMISPDELAHSLTKQRERETG